MSRKQYDKAFKLEALKLAEEVGVRQAAADLGMLATGALPIPNARIGSEPFPTETTWLGLACSLLHTSLSPCSWLRSRNVPARAHRLIALGMGQFS